MNSKFRNAAMILALAVVLPALANAGGTIPQGTTIHVVIDQAISSKDGKIGQRVTGTVSKSVTVGGKVLIPKGSTAKLSVSSVQASGRLSTPAKLYLKLRTVTVGGKTYLLLRRADQNAFAIVNVSDPAKPLLAEKDDLRQPAGAEVDLPRPGSALAIAFVPERNSAPAASAMPTSAITLPTESVRLIDLTDPQHPKTLKVFNRVTSVASDDGRKLLFLVNNEGLWIVSHHRNHPLPMCTSEAEIEPLPDCQ